MFNTRWGVEQADVEVYEGYRVVYEVEDALTEEPAMQMRGISGLGVAAGLVFGIQDQGAEGGLTERDAPVRASEGTQPFT